MTPGFWRGKKVFLTGHTGFKGGWLALWLGELGAEVHGYALAPEYEHGVFETCRLGSRLARSVFADIRDLGSLSAAVAAAQPDIVLHLAAQPLVRESYRSPVETYEVNVIGTVNLLQAVRAVETVQAVVNVTTDKCYENREWPWPYRESDALGGSDPYANSKACSELVTAAFRASFFEEQGVALATARSGNVIGGGDRAEDRLVPDFLRALDAGETLRVRSPTAVRPWQHVLEPLQGYLLLAEQLCSRGADLAQGWNFGPSDADMRTVGWIVGYLCGRANAAWEKDDSEQPHETNILRLDSSKARFELSWQPRWDLAAALDRTLEWHEAWRSGSDMEAVGLEQIQAYQRATG